MPQPITADAESQRFIAMAIDSDGSIFSAWLDKRNRAAAKEKAETYTGAGLAFAWSRDQAATFSDAHIAHDNICECCRIAVAFAARGRPVVLFRNLFDMSVQDHAVMTFEARDKPGPVYRVSDDDWAPLAQSILPEPLSNHNLRRLSAYLRWRCQSEVLEHDLGSFNTSKR